MKRKRSGEVSSFRLSLMTKRLINFSSVVGKKKNQSKSIITITTVRAWQSEGKHSSRRALASTEGGGACFVCPALTNDPSQTPGPRLHKPFLTVMNKFKQTNKQKHIVTTFKTGMVSTKVETVSCLCGVHVVAAQTFTLLTGLNLIINGFFFQRFQEMIGYCLFILRWYFRTGQQGHFFSIYKQ